MFRSLMLLLSPEKQWERMALRPPSAPLVLVFGLLPLIVLTLGVESWGLMHLGEMVSGIGRIRIPPERALKYAVFYGTASFLVILVGGYLLQAIGQSFNLATTYGACVVLIGFGYSPIFWLRCPDAFPQINTWICWAVGAVLSFRILYHGIAHWLRPEQTKGFGILLVSVIYTIVLSGLVHFASVQVLHGRFLRKVYPDRNPATPVSKAETGIPPMVFMGRGADRPPIFGFRA